METRKELTEIHDLIIDTVSTKHEDFVGTLLAEMIQGRNEDRDYCNISNKG